MLKKKTLRYREDTISLSFAKSGHVKPLDSISYTWCIVLTGLYGNGLIFCVLQIMCQIAYLKHWQKKVFSCRDSRLSAPLSEQTTFQQDVLMTWAWMTQTDGFPMLLWEMYHESWTTQEAWFTSYWIYGRANVNNGVGGFCSSSHSLYCVTAPP